MIKTIHTLLTVMLIVSAFVSGCIGQSSWQEEFGLSERSLGPTGRNQYFILEPGFQLVLEGKTGLFRNNYEKLMITVLNETRQVDGVMTRVVEEKEWKNDQIIEVSRNFFAICETTKDVFYFGEEVDMYKHGKFASHKGAWLAGENGAKPGLMIPGEPREGMKYYQEIAKGVAMDRAEIVNLDEKLETPAGAFSKCLKTKEGTALNFFEREYKTYAPGIGLIQDANLLLTGHGFTGKREEDSKEIKSVELK
jgi:hypothetical protein